MFGDFVVGVTYNRRRDIHLRFGGQQQGGIATPSGFPVIFAFTGSGGAENGYADSFEPDGTFRYYGEGQIGDMKWRAGNSAIRDHAGLGKDLLLFSNLGKGLVKFEGQFACGGFELESAPDRNGDARQAIVFHLVPIDCLDQAPLAEVVAEAHGLSLHDLRQRALNAATQQKPGKVGDARQNLYDRSQVVRRYVLIRAGGVCECCGRDAPFLTKKGAPYLEPHHIRRLSDGGLDDPRFMGAICPNCHCEIHRGANGDELNKTLLARVSKTERSLAEH